jgi:hypothetical protein
MNEMIRRCILREGLWRKSPCASRKRKLNKYGVRLDSGSEVLPNIKNPSNQPHTLEKIGTAVKKELEK